MRNKIVFIFVVLMIIVFPGCFQRQSWQQYEIPDSVTEIGEKAFRDNQLVKVIMPSRITLIEPEVFKGNKLIRITIPSKKELFHIINSVKLQLVEI